MAAPQETARPRPGEELDPVRVRDFLAQALPEFSGQPEIRQFPGGASNLTYLIRIGDQELVLRRPPFGTKARSAHDMGREYQVLSRLHSVFRYSPRPLALCEDPRVLGEPFYVMERLRGTILRRDLPPGLSLTAEAARALCENLVDVQLELHQVDYVKAGLADLGRPEGYVERQVGGWSKRYRAARTDDVPDDKALMEWLADNMPQDPCGAAIIHNDYKFDNVVLEGHGDGLRIHGVLDWEMATLGDPLMDLGCSLAYWVEAEDPAPLQSVRMMPTHLPGMMSRREIVDYYTARSGHDPVRFDFYYAFGLFRLAVIVQQIYYRYAHGQTSDPRFAGFGQLGAILSANAEAVAAGRRSV